MFFEQKSPEVILFFILYGITGVVPFIGALYLLLRRANAIAPGVTPPVRLRRWAASFLIVAALAHVWWILFYLYSGNMHSVTYMVIVAIDFVGMVTTIAGTMLSMLQDRRRPVWPAFVAMIPFMVLWVLQMTNPGGLFIDIAIVYNMVIYVLFFIYMVFALRRYGRWLNDNYADLENKKVWLNQLVSLGYVLTFILYVLVDTNLNLIFLLHFVELVFFCLLVWRVDTLPSFTPDVSYQEKGVFHSSADNSVDETTDSNILKRGIGSETLAQIEQLLKEHCVATQLYLQHDLTLQQLAQAIGTNRSYLSQYFSRQGITYNIYINNLRINHFISRYQETAAAGLPFVAQQLASESGYRSYSTFSLAFKQRMGQSVTAWMHEAEQSE
jgi:AraC-like DNA-binding protein